MFKKRLSKPENGNKLPVEKSPKKLETTPKRRSTSAWQEAPLPRLTDPELAQSLVKEGCYRTFEEAYLNVPVEHLQRIQETTNDYWKRLSSPFIWKKSPLPHPTD